jgi:predicted HicB family RNase H-like nuclease
MQTEAILDGIERAIESQLAIGEGSGALQDAAAALMAALRPALRQGALQLAEQAATEIGAQLAGYSVAVVVEDGEPSLLVREDATARSTIPEDLSARITLRLPDSLKEELEAAAGESGDSVNAFVVKALSTRAARRASRRITETFET